MKYIVYLTVNNKSTINGINRIYIGVHLTENPEIFDGYIGCGVYINLPSTYMYPKTPFQSAVKKYGVSSFTRSILYIYDDKESAYIKEAELVTSEFIKLPHVYNACLGGNKNFYQGKPLYQFDLKGNLVKKWDYGIEAYEFYGIPREKFNYAILDKHPLIDSLWSTTENIDVTEYSTKPWGEPKVTHLYTKEGKWIGEFISRKECAKYLDLEDITICNAIKRNSLLLDKYYVSDSLVDEYIPKAKKQLSSCIFYVYENYKYIGLFVGKELMLIIREFSWTQIRDRLRNQNNWIKDFYISDTKIEESEIPVKKVGKGMTVEIYTKYGDYIETLYSIKDVKEKYKVPASKIKNIQLGDRYYKDYIFKYVSRSLK